MVREEHQAATHECLCFRCVKDVFSLHLQALEPRWSVELVGLGVN